MIIRFLNEENAASASEYAILVSFVIVAVYMAVVQFALGNTFGVVAQTVIACVNGAC